MNDREFIELLNLYLDHEISAAEILRRGGRSSGSDEAQSQSGSINPWREQ